MDIVQEKRIREWTLLSLVGIMALVANLPRRLLNDIGVQPDLLMAVLGVLVLLALFLYVKFFFFLLFMLLTVGANVPGKWAQELGMNQEVLLATLIAMVAMSLLNYAAKLLPTGLEKRARKQNPRAFETLRNAIERGNVSYVATLLSMDIDLDAADADGMTPLMLAARRGDIKIARLILKHGASPSIAGPSGRASAIALQNNFPAVSELIKVAEEVDSAELVRRAKDGAVVGD
jgi:hypothetical protein